MPIINSLKEPQNQQIAIEINADTLNEIHKYCKWAQIQDIGFFLGEAAKFVFKKDKEYKANFKTSNRGRKKSKKTEAA